MHTHLPVFIVCIADPDYPNSLRSAVYQPPGVTPGGFFFSRPIFFNEKSLLLWLFRLKGVIPLAISAVQLLKITRQHRQRHSLCTENGQME